MRSFTDYNPAAVTVWFICIIGTAMFSRHPLMIAVSLAGSVLLFLILNGRNHGKSHGFFFILFIVLALINPVISHNGKTVLFVFNNNPVTLEALLYGINSSAMITGVLYWFRNFSSVMTSEKLLYLTGMLSPKLSLVLSMTLRYIPLFIRQMKKINDSQKAMGLYKDDNIIDTIRGKMRVFSVLVTWALENGIITADSMEARGYGSGKRTQMKNFRFRKSDALLIVSCVILTSLIIASSSDNSLDFTFYPVLSAVPVSNASVTAYISYTVLNIIPLFIETEVHLRWKYLISKI